MWPTRCVFETPVIKGQIVLEKLFFFLLFLLEKIVDKTDPLGKISEQLGIGGQKQCKKVKRPEKDSTSASYCVALQSFLAHL
jgi:hypothetical protein